MWTFHFMISFEFYLLDIIRCVFLTEADYNWEVQLFRLEYSQSPDSAFWIKGSEHSQLHVLWYKTYGAQTHSALRSCGQCYSWYTVSCSNKWTERPGFSWSSTWFQEFDVSQSQFSCPGIKINTPPDCVKWTDWWLSYLNHLHYRTIWVGTGWHVFTTYSKYVEGWI